MENLEKLTKNQLITIIKEQDKRLEGYSSLKNDSEELRKELELYSYLKELYVPTMKENEGLNNSIRSLQQRIYNLEDLCNRQQKIIDSRCD